MMARNGTAKHTGYPGTSDAELRANQPLRTNCPGKPDSKLDRRLCQLPPDRSFRQSRYGRANVGWYCERDDREQNFRRDIMMRPWSMITLGALIASIFALPAAAQQPQPPAGVSPGQPVAPGGQQQPATPAPRINPGEPGFVPSPSSPSSQPGPSLGSPPAVPGRGLMPEAPPSDRGTADRGTTSGGSSPGPTTPSSGSPSPPLTPGASGGVGGQASGGMGGMGAGPNGGGAPGGVGGGAGAGGGR
jgi:hypothetical protein